MSEPTLPVSSSDLAFDLLEGLKRAWSAVDPRKASDIAAGFARGTGGIDVDWLVEKLGPPPPPPVESGAADLVRWMRAQLANWDYLLPGNYVPEPPTERRWLFWKRPIPITQELLVWAGEIARARVLMDLDAAADMLEQKESS